MKRFILLTILTFALVLIALETALRRWPWLVTASGPYAALFLCLGAGLAAVAIVAASADDLARAREWFLEMWYR